jgi:phosphoinositide-3-kinase regulatory subunit 4
MLGNGHFLISVSSSTRSKSDSENEKLTSIGVIELQKLGVVPQTVFLSGRPSDIPIRPFRLSEALPRSPMMAGSRRASFSSAAPQSNSSDKGSTVPHVVEDLRRQLAAMNVNSKDRRSSVASTSASPITSLPPRIKDIKDISRAPESPVLPASPSGESVQSNPFLQISQAKRSRAPFAVSDGQKAAPAIASTMTNVTGLLEQGAAIRSHTPSTSHMPSGRTSPVSNAGTIRADPSAIKASASTHQGLLEKMFQEHDSSRDALKDLGPRIRDVPLKRRTNVRQSFSHRIKSESRDGCQLIATLGSHSSRVNGIAVAPDHSYFITCSDDKTVKIWDTTRLERNVTAKPRQVYTSHNARVTALCHLERHHCFASAADNGTIHVVRVYLSHSGSSPKYGKLKMVRYHEMSRPGDYATVLFHYLSGWSLSVRQRLDELI